MIKRFNTIAKRLPENYKILPLKEESFHDNRADPSSEEMLGPLWSFENLRMTVNDGFTESDLVQSTAPIYMDAVNLALGIRRAQEEVDLINREVSRLVNWIIRRISAYSSFSLSHPKYGNSASLVTMYWHDYQLLEDLRERKELLRAVGEEDLSKLSGNWQTYIHLIKGEDTAMLTNYRILLPDQVILQF